jgi:hypothetical protein
MLQQLLNVPASITGSRREAGKKDSDKDSADEHQGICKPEYCILLTTLPHQLHVCGSAAQVLVRK